jgi:hypothetical protein
MHMIQTEKPGQPLPAFVKTKKVGPFLIQLAGVAEKFNELKASQVSEALPHPWPGYGFTKP